MEINNKTNLTKTCSKCNRGLSLDSFYKGKTKDGLESICKDCKKETCKK
jgi:hypothetical protein